MINCNACKFYKPDTSYDFRVGKCLRIPKSVDFKLELENEETYIDSMNPLWGVEQLAITYDAEMYSSHLKVHPNFGCVLGRRK